MDWLDTPETETLFMDAARLFEVLDGVANAPNLYTTAANKFQVAGEKPTYDEDAFDYLLAEAFVIIPIKLRNNIDSFRHLHHTRESARNELKEVYRRIKTLTVQLKTVERELATTRFLTSKKATWERKARQDKLSHEIEELTLKRRRLESDLEKAGNLLKTLLDSIYRDQKLREGAWFAERPVLLTEHGRFLHDYLSEMNPANFKGRTLGEILEIGPALA